MARIFNAVRAENTPPRHVQGDFKQALNYTPPWEDRWKGEINQH
jgi:hypothetical protein